MPASQSPGQGRLTWLRHPALRVGLTTGLYLSSVLVAWLIISNRIPWSDHFAGIRNAVAAAITLLLMLIPVARFLRSPGRLFVAGLTSWAVLSCTYMFLGLLFERLHSRMEPFHVFILGGVVYGLLAVVTWVASLVLAARHHPVNVPRRRPY